ncbi:hypothetical protein FIBSPDRAFT_962136 [Athelia psychrophila]|uniref:Uncharacterized protein n=1 Tax=Athelia psychrophila TaxID=1759441 RepID=A0A166AH55_9AGAM|nr:hypothetical protein FIBSPDRAFT_962136 [Fibularhizoctonia sp. CBS 109695]
MAQDLLPISMMFHASFALVYFPATAFSFFLPGWRAGVMALPSLVLLGVLAALDLLIMRRKFDQIIFLAIEVVVAVILPACLWPIITVCIDVFAPGGGNLGSYSNASSKFFGGHPLGDVYNNAFSLGFVFTATFTVLAMSAAFVLYICIAAVIDKFHGNAFLPKYPGDYTLSSRTLGHQNLLGTSRTSDERTAMSSHCANYIFRKSIFRKHAFEPTGWAILRGATAVYSCITLLAFSIFLGWSQVMNYTKAGFTVQETLLPASQYDQVHDAGLFFGYVTTVSSDLEPFPANVISSQLNTEESWRVVSSVTTNNTQVWGTDFQGQSNLPGFNVSWTGQNSLALWVTAALIFFDSGYTNSDNFGLLNSTQVSFAPPICLPPFKETSITLTAIMYRLDGFAWISYEPDIVNTVDSKNNTSISTFSYAPFQAFIAVRNLSSPSAFSMVAYVISSIGGIFAFINGGFTLVSGRTVMDILFGSRAISPFGLLGMVTRNRFKRLIHEQFPRMQQDIERGGMAAYISEVAIDAAMADSQPVKGQTGASQSSYSGDEAGGGDIISLRHVQVRSSDVNFGEEDVCALSVRTSGEE